MRSRWKWIKCFFYILSRRKICCCWWHDICRWSDRVIERQQNIGVPASQPASKSVILIKDYIEPGWQSLLPWVAWEAAVLLCWCCCAVGTVSWCYYATARNNPGRASGARGASQQLQSHHSLQQSHHFRYHILEYSTQSTVSHPLISWFWLLPKFK